MTHVSHGLSGSAPTINGMWPGPPLAPGPPCTCRRFTGMEVTDLPRSPAAGRYLRNIANLQAVASVDPGQEVEGTRVSPEISGVVDGSETTLRLSPAQGPGTAEPPRRPVSDRYLRNIADSRFVVALLLGEAPTGNKGHRGTPKISGVLWLA